MLVGAVKYNFTKRQAPKGAKKRRRRAYGFDSLRLYILKKEDKRMSLLTAICAIFYLPIYVIAKLVKGFL